MTLTPEQIKAGRRLLGWTQGDLARRASISSSTTCKAETGAYASGTALARLQAALEAAGAEFTNSGQPSVKIRRAEAGTIAADQLNSSNDE